MANERPTLGWQLYCRPFPGAAVQLPHQRRFIDSAKLNRTHFSPQWGRHSCLPEKMRPLRQTGMSAPLNILLRSFLCGEKYGLERVAGFDAIARFIVHLLELSGLLALVALLMPCTPCNRSAFGEGAAALGRGWTSALAPPCRHPCRPCHHPCRLSCRLPSSAGLCANRQPLAALLAFTLRSFASVSSICSWTSSV